VRQNSTADLSTRSKVGGEGSAITADVSAASSVDCTVGGASFTVGTFPGMVTRQSTRRRSARRMFSGAYPGRPTESNGGLRAGQSNTAHPQENETLLEPAVRRRRSGER